MIKNLLLFTFFFALFLSAQANTLKPGGPVKDTVMLMNGDKLSGEVIDTIYHKVKVKYLKKNGKEKTILIDDDLVFSVLFKDGHEKVIYEQDTINGNYFGVDETRMFILGERDAEKYFRTPFATISSIAIGFSSGYLASVSFLAALPPFAYSAILMIPKIKIKYKTVSTPEYLNYDTYVMGYEKVARRKKLFRSLIGGIGGLTAGIFTFQVAFPNFSIN
jgi:hypothetical protein